MNEIDLLKRRLERERLSRKQAEAILEEKALELYYVNNELKALNEGLEKRIIERTSELETSESRLSALIANLHAAILVEDENRLIVLANSTFCQLFNIPVAPEMMKGMDCSGTAEQSKSFFADPEGFVQGVEEILQLRRPVIDEVLYMADGRILERDYIPILFDGQYRGHLWQYRDVTREYKAQDRLRRSEEKYRGIIENMELGLLEVDRDDIIVRPYPLFCKMVGYTPEELIGRHASQVLLPPEYLKILERQNQNRQTGETGVYEVPLIKKNGERIWALISGAPVIDMDGNMTGSIGIHYDITRQKNLQRELEEARQRAEAAQEAEKQFLANMSHEIRTPLNAIIGMSYLLYDTKPTQEQLELLEILKSSADILRTLINDVLDLSKVRAGKIELQQNEFDLVGLVKALLKSVELRLHDRPIRVVSDIDPGIVHTVIGDDLLLNQILLNLLGNAEKFTEKGEIGISVRRLATPPDAPDNTILLQFQVFDTGIGIPEDKQQVIFQDFRQVDGDIKRRYGGTGLGLSITKKLVEAQGGTISVHSQDNKGTVFTVVLAYQDSGRVKKLQAQAEAEEQFTGRPSKILVAEDNPMNRRYVGTLLQKWGMEFVMAYNGREAVARSQEERFDLVLMDIQMPEMDGYEACLAIRNAHNPNQHTPMIALTASAMNSKKDKAFEVGMNDYLSKPFQPAQLLEKLNYFLQGDFDELILPNTVRHTFEFNALLDQHTLRELYADDWGYAFEMFGMFLRYSLKELELMPELLEASDWEALHRLAHKVKPTLGMVGAPDLEKQFELLEMTAKSAPEKEHIQTLWDDIRTKMDILAPVVEADWSKLKKLLND